MNNGKEYTSLSGKSSILNEEDSEKLQLELLQNLFISKLTNLTRINLIKWSKIGEAYSTEWGIYDITLWTIHYKVINRLNNSSFEINIKNSYLEQLRETLDLLFKSNIHEAMFLTMYDEIQNLSQTMDEGVKE